MGQLILVRSGKTEYDEQDRIAGNLDLPLTISGEAEIADLADELKESQIEAIYTSATQSAEQSAQTSANVSAYRSNQSRAGEYRSWSLARS